ncbi:PsiF family protein [Thauera sp. SDU_THAU2]|uniref:PsiF family protein n=1 Tax=Thauera sp. SDU_THAU2 TaxID=3136633 RepID=UPI00311E3A24
MMKNTLHALVASLAVLMLAPADALANPQHERMRNCNAEAKAQELKGDERKAFMSTCLKGKHVAAETGAAAAVPVADEQPVSRAAVPDDGVDKKKACNQAATEQSLTGAKRKAFIAECTKA